MYIPEIGFIIKLLKAWDAYVVMPITFVPPINKICTKITLKNLLFYSSIVCTSPSWNFAEMVQYVYVLSSSGLRLE